MKKFKYTRLNSNLTQQIELQEDSYLEIIAEFKTIENYLKSMISEDIKVEEIKDKPDLVKGFKYFDAKLNHRRIFYMDKQGKDISFSRWRLNLYCLEHIALTVFFITEKEYLDFISEHESNCYKNYEDFKLAKGTFNKKAITMDKIKKIRKE